MESKLSRHAILQGHVDSYCLVCESYFKCAMILDGHMLNPDHRNKLNNTGYVEKFKDSRIRKVKNGYFCEFCNLLLNTAAKVSVHIEDPQHISTKGAMLLRRIGDNIVAFENLVISDKAWNGIIDETCVLCNTEFDNLDIHKSETSHKLNLVQCKTEFGTWGIIYRKIDDNSIHCLPCNKILTMTLIASHFNTPEHKQMCSSAPAAPPALPSLPAKVAPAALPAPTGPPVAAVVPTGRTPGPAPAPVNKPRPKNQLADNKHEKSKAMLTDALRKRPLRPITPAVDTQRPLIGRVVSNEYEYLICHFLKASSFIVRVNFSKMRCILCERSIRVEDASSHLEDLHHHYLLKIHKKRLQVYNEIEQAGAETEILESLTRFENNNIDIDLIKGTAVCNVCFRSIEFLSDVIDAHIDEHKVISIAQEIAARKERDAFEAAAKLEAELDREAAAARYAASHARHAETTRTRLKPKPRNRSRSRSDSAMTVEELKDWAIEHNITFNSFQRVATCNICHSTVPIDLKSLKEHVAGNVHRKLLAKTLTGDTSASKSKTKLIKVPQKSYVKSLILVENIIFQHFIINNKFVITYKSMCFLGKSLEGYLKCFLCDEDLIDESVVIEVHRTRHHHMSAMDNVQVITSWDTDFIRQAASGEFHCGFCNIMTKDWDDLQKHFNTMDHKESRTCAEWRLLEFTK
ncbi:uncharacterized protein LOC115444264 [Manduca sexta]|uniref:C2H2-type domain-containing protein n=1 Tax=Manduca sexta TaxID=7130 RepID=A0A922CMD3_MANSE|nr:uncharacterized protein LOC115444264 [Manduca sexta]KAG6451234.1 hypothetical protein O3G_MSEX007015 [Manduca sexta]